ncbi:MAG TPA: SpoIIE family protein phosphatase [Nocardioidaceae bacterium]
MSRLRVPSWAGELAHLDALDEVVLAGDLDGRLVFTNAAGARVYRDAASRLGGVEVATAVLPEDEYGAFTEISEQVLGGVTWRGRLDVLSPEGGTHPAEVTCTPVHRRGDVVGILCVVEDSTSERGHERQIHRLSDRLARLARVAADLGTADDVEAVTRVVVSEAADAVGATVASLSVKASEDTIALVGLRGGLEGAAERWATYPLERPTPAGDVVRTGERLVLVGREEIHRRYPGLERAATGERSMACFPLRVMRQTIGVVTFSFPGRRVLDAAELEFLGILADSCAQALERVRATEEAAEQAARIRFLADATSELSTSLDYERTLAKLARMVVPDFADWCAIDLVEDSRLHRLAVEHVDPAKVRLAQELGERYPADPASPAGAWQVIRSGRSELAVELTDELLADRARDEEHLTLVRQLGLRSALAVPLRAGRRVLGVMTWVMAESGRRYTPSHLAFAEDLGRRAGVAIDNALLHSQTREVAVELQHAVLPELPREIAGWQVAGHYSPSGRTQVGGDFYDAVPLRDGRLVLFVGDVMGRGVGAAAAMAQIRAAVRAYLAVDPQPRLVLQKLDQMFATFEPSQLVTLVYLLADPAQDLVTMVNAGHPPPVVLRRGGVAEQLPTTGNSPLGAPPGERSEVSVTLCRGDTLLAFTDGLIERRAEDIDLGQTRLLGVLSELGEGSLDDALDGLVERVRDHSRADDVAAVAARRTDPVADTQRHRVLRPRRDHLPFGVGPG